MMMILCEAEETEKERMKGDIDVNNINAIRIAILSLWFESSTSYIICCSKGNECDEK